MRKLFLLLMGVVLIATQAMAQRTVTGVVSDEKGNPVAKASVVVKGTTAGTTTKDDGTFSLVVPANAKALVFSAVDMSTVEVAIGTNSTINASLKTEDKSMTEVVVTAFGIKKDKKTLGYGVSQINSAELNRARTPNITNAIGSKIAGIRVQGSGGSFTGSSIIIRGYTTFTGSNQPLFVVDGIPIDNGGGGTPLQNGPSTSNRGIDLNQDDIESISVLKGPSAAVLYGSRASNGVILITTKKGKAGQKTAIEFSSNYSIETVNRLPNYQNDYAQGNNGIFSAVAQTSWGPKMGTTVTTAYNPATNTNTLTQVLSAYPNNVADLFRNGTNFQNNVAFSGGSDRNSFRFSYGYLRSTGVLDNNTLIRHNFSINSMQKVNNYLTVTVSATYTNNFSKRSQQGNQLSNPLFRGWITPRSYDLTGTPFEDAAGNQLYPLGEEDLEVVPHLVHRYPDQIGRAHV